jgi:hypothetical protein
MVMDQSQSMAVIKFTKASLYLVAVAKSSFCSFVLFIYIALLCNIVHFEKIIFARKARGHGLVPERELALLGRAGLRFLAFGHFLGAEFRDAFDQLHGDGLGEWEADRAFLDFVWCKVVL